MPGPMAYPSTGAAPPMNRWPCSAWGAGGNRRSAPPWWTCAGGSQGCPGACASGEPRPSAATSNFAWTMRGAPSSMRATSTPPCVVAADFRKLRPRHRDAGAGGHGLDQRLDEGHVFEGDSAILRCVRQQRGPPLSAFRVDDGEATDRADVSTRDDGPEPERPKVLCPVGCRSSPQGVWNGPAQHPRGEWKARRSESAAAVEHPAGPLPR